MSISFNQDCLHSTFSPQLSSKTNSSHYEKLLNIIFTLKYKRKNDFFWECGQQVWLKFVFACIMLKQFNSFITFIKISSLGGREINTLECDLSKVPGSIPGSDKDFLCLLVFSLCSCSCMITFLPSWSKKR